MEKHSYLTDSWHWRQEGVEFVAFQNARSRCLYPWHPNYRYYGGRGIEWMFRDFDQFMNALWIRPPDHQLDRIDNDGPYHPDNVRWATALENCRNRGGKFDKRRWME